MGIYMATPSSHPYINGNFNGNSHHHKPTSYGQLELSSNQHFQRWTCQVNFMLISPNHVCLLVFNDVLFVAINL